MPIWKHPIGVLRALVPGSFRSIMKDRLVTFQGLLLVPAKPGTMCVSQINHPGMHTYTK